MQHNSCPGQSSATDPALYASPRLLALGDSAWTLEFGLGATSAVQGRVLGFCQALGAAREAGVLTDSVIEWVPTFRSVTVHVAPDEADFHGLGAILLTMAGECVGLERGGRLWHLPVSFAPEHAPDLAGVADACGLMPEAVVAGLCDTEFSVAMLGFLPGFPYLSGLPAALELPRLATPRTRVPARSIAIAGRMCAAYPWESPGGWHLVGRTPIRLFDIGRPAAPALLAAGDRVRWQAVDGDCFAEMEARWAAGAGDPAEFLRVG